MQSYKVSHRITHFTTGKPSGSAISAVLRQAELSVFTAYKIGGHKMTKNTIIRIRKTAYIYRPRKLFKNVLGNYRLKRKQTSQLMVGKLVSYRICLNSDTSFVRLKFYAQDVYNSYCFRWEVKVLLKLLIPGPKWNKFRSNAKVNYTKLFLCYRSTADNFFDFLY